MKYFVNNSTDAYYSLALEEYMFKIAKPGDNFFSLWRNDNAIIIGKNQNPYAEINQKYVDEHGIKVVRRITGGGAVYHDLNNVNFTFITDQTPELDFKSFTKPVVDALKSFGITACHQGRNDIAIGDAKISGNAQHCSNGMVLHHGTILFDTNLETLSRCLNVAKVKLKSKGVASIRSRVTNVKEFCGDLNVLEFMTKLRECILAENNGDVVELTKQQLAEVEELRDTKYATWEHNFGSAPEFDIEYSARFEGCGSITLCLCVKSGIISKCRIFGDFFGDDTAPLEKMFEGVTFRTSDIEEKLAGVDFAKYFRGIEGYNFFEIFNVE